MAAISSNRARAALIPRYFLDCVVAIGGNVTDTRQGRSSRWVATGTGFFYGQLVKSASDPNVSHYDVYLVTAKHVVDEWRIQKASAPTGVSIGDMMVRVNPVASDSSATDIALEDIKDRKDAAWTSHPKGKDVAVLAVDIDSLRSKALGATFFADDEMAANISKLNDLKVSAGDGTFVLGFPMGLVGNLHNAVIVRQGVIARIEDMLISKSDSFLLDSFVFPGNSGGPVILRPEITSLSGTSSQPRTYLIGMIVSYQPYIDVAVSQQTHRPRVTFEENSGLATVLPTDYITDAIAAEKKTR
jgi:S1-C subfamily serine protease